MDIVQKIKNSKIGKWVQRPLVSRLINQWELDLCVIFFLFETVLQTVQVITRYVFAYSFVWAEELAMIMFIWMGWLSISAAITYRKHMGITAFVELFPKKIQRYFKIASDIVFMLFCFFFFSPSVQMVTKLMRSPAKTALLRIPKWIPYVIIPVMLAISFIRLIQDICRLATEPDAVMGKSRSAMDFAVWEKEYQDKVASGELKPAIEIGKKGGR